MKNLNNSGLAHLFILIAIVVGFAVVGTYLIVNSSADAPNRIVDVSYPQCGQTNYAAKYGIIGVNNGKPRTKSPCFRKQAKKITKESIYVVASYVGGGRYSAYETGYRDGQYDLKAAGSIGKRSYMWWIDVEQMAPWSKNNQSNVEYLRGMMEAIESGNTKSAKPSKRIDNSPSSIIRHKVGFYSTEYQWNQITGGWRNGHPAWYAITTEPPGSQAVISSACRQGFNGGPTWLVQYTDQRAHLDINYACDSDFYRNI